MLKPCGKGRPTCKNCSVNLKMTFNDISLLFFLLLVTREFKKSNIFLYYMYIWQLVNVEHKAQKHGVLSPS